MGRLTWIGVVVALAAGFAAGMVFGPVLMPRPGATSNSNRIDLSALPEELRDKHRDEDFLRSEATNYAHMQEALAQRAAERAARQPLDLPNGMESVPFGLVYKPGGEVHWPEGMTGEFGDALEAAKDSWVILNYWASWCGPCVHELPEMGKAAPLYAGRGIELIAVNTDPMRKDTPASARRLFEEKGVETLPPYVAEGAAVDRLFEAAGMSMAAASLPISIIFAPGGVPYAVFEGGNLGSDEVWTAPQTLAFLDAITAGD